MPVFWTNTAGIHLGIMPRPRGYDWLSDDLRLLQREGVDVLVSALTPSESEELGLSAEAINCGRNNLLFISFPIEDRSVPTSHTEFSALVDQLVEFSKNRKSVVIHCRAGIGRSSLIAASVLVRIGLTVDSAFRAIEESRGCPVPDAPEQRHWVELWARSSSGTMS